MEPIFASKHERHDNPLRRVVMSFTKKDKFKKKHDAHITNGILVIITRLTE